MTPWVYLSSVGPGTGQRAATSASPRTTACGVRQLRTEPDVDQVHGPAPVRGQHVHGLQRAEGDGRGGRDRRAVDGAGVGVDAAGRVDGQHRHRAGVRDADQLGGRGAQRPAAGEADDAVEHEVGPSDRRGAVGPGVDGPAAGPAQRRQPAGVGPPRVEQHRDDPDAAAAQLRAGPQRVAAVVARSHEERDATPVDAASIRRATTASPNAARRMRAPGGTRASTVRSAVRTCSTVKTSRTRRP